MAAPVESISDTAKWVAYYRAEESDRKDALFHDPFARILAGPQGKEITQFFDKRGELSWVLSVRTHILDEIILDLIKNQGVDTVLNLACGLDTRPYRLPLPADLTWIGVDLAPLLRYKKEILQGAKPKCQFEEWECDLSKPAERRALFSKVNERSKKTLIITEGLLIYLADSDNQALAEDLASYSHFKYWLMDIHTPEVIKKSSSRIGKQLKAANAPFRFAPKEGAQFFLPLGWRELQFRSYIREAMTVNRLPPYGKVWRILFKIFPKKVKERLERISGISLLVKHSF